MNISNAKLNGEFTVTAPSIQFKDGHCENAESGDQDCEKNSAGGFRQAVVRRSRFGRHADGFQCSVSAIIVADSVEGSLHSKNDLVTFDRLIVQRKQNEFMISGRISIAEGFALGSRTSRRRSTSH